MTKSSVMNLTLAIGVAGYFGAYFLAVDYVDIGDERPLYFVEYHIGSHSLDGLYFFFEPARQIDDLFIRRRSFLPKERH